MNFHGYRDYADWYDNGPGSENHKREMAQQSRSYLEKRHENQRKSALLLDSLVSATDKVLPILEDVLREAGEIPKFRKKRLHQELKFAIKCLKKARLIDEESESCK